MYVDGHLIEGVTLGQHDIKLVVDRKIEYLSGIEQKLEVMLGCYGPDTFKGFLYASISIICIILAIVFYNDLDKKSVFKNEV